MGKSRQVKPLPACYAIVHPGLEDVASAEIASKLHGEIKRTGRGVVVFKVDSIDARLLTLRTVEDVFLLAWGTDELTYRAVDLDLIRRWTAKKPDWNQLLQLHHAVRPRPRGKPTFRIVTQMEGKHGYLRKHAAKALGEGLEGKFPASWRHAEENASVEFWLSIDGKTAVCGLRLSDRTMRHRTYKVEHRPASLRPTVAAAMVQLVEAKPHEVVLDPMCGTGTILAEYLLTTSSGSAHVPVWGGDVEMGAVRTAAANLRRVAPLWLDLGEPPVRRGAALFRWDARRLPLPDASVDVVMSNPPFGKQLGDQESLPLVYRGLARECDRVLKPGGRAVFLVSDAGMWRNALRGLKWSARQQVQIRILGQPAVLSVWRKEG